jgi:hypothetical protein
VGAWVLVLGLSLPSSSWGQSKPEPAAVAFQFKVAQLMKTEFGQMLPVEEMTGGSGQAFGQAIMQAKLFRGVVTLPGSVEDFLFMDGDNLPVEMYVELTFDESAEAKAAITALEEELKPKSNIREEANLRYFSPERGANFSLIFGLPNKLVMISDSYKFDADNMGNVSAAIKQAMSGIGEAPAALLLDFDQARPLIDSGLDMARQEAPPAVAPFLEIPKQISLLQMVADPGTSQAMTFTFTSPDEEKGELLQESLQGLVGMGKIAAQQMNPNDPPAKVVNQVLGQLKPTRDGKVITLSIPKIEGLEDLLR